MYTGAVVVLLGAIAITLLVSEKLAKAGCLPLVLARKLVHIVAISAVAIAPAFFFNQWLLAGIMLVFITLLFWAVGAGKLAIDLQRQRKSWGIALFPLSFLLLLLCFGKAQPWLVVYPMLVLAWADAAAAIVGETLARQYFTLTGDRKSLLGSFTFATCTFLLLFFLPQWVPAIHPIFAWPSSEGVLWPSLVAIALLAALAEALGSGGADNVTVPLMVAWAMQVAALPHAPLLLWQGLAAVLVLVWVAIGKKWLDWGGAITAAWLGMVVWVAGTWTTALPLLFFFVTGTLLGKLPRMAEHDAKHAHPRDWMQVVANGGVAGILLIVYSFHPSPLWMLAFWASVAICTADTWSSEIGQWAGGKVINIVSGKPLTPGLSGGISWKGSLGGLAGAVAIGCLGYWLAALSIFNTLLVVAFGFVGMLLDSVFGSLLQAKYVLADGGVTENRLLVQEKIPINGWKWVTNDVVNLTSNLAMLLLLLGLASWFG